LFKLAPGLKGPHNKLQITTNDVFFLNQRIKRRKNGDKASLKSRQSAIRKTRITKSNSKKKLAKALGGKRNRNTELKKKHERGDNYY